MISLLYNERNFTYFLKIIIFDKYDSYESLKIIVFFKKNFRSCLIILYNNIFLHLKKTT